MGTGQFSLQNWNQTGRRELWPGVQRYTLCGRFYNTSQDVHSKADSKWETAIHCCSETSERCAQYTECFKTHRLTARINFCLAFWCKALECPPPPPPPTHLTGGADGREVENFLEEIAMMKKVSSGECCHVVQMVGCVSTALPLALALEYIAFGDLLSYLRRWSQKVSKKVFVHQCVSSYNI